MPQFICYITVIFVLLHYSRTEASRILVVVPTPSISHQIVFRPLTQELATRGHDVTVITADPAFPKGDTPSNLTEIDVHDISYKMWQENFYAKVTGNKNALLAQLETILETITIVVEEILKTEEVSKLINEKQHFDLLIVEAYVKPLLVLSHIFKAPVIQMSSYGRAISNYEDIGAPTHPMLYPRNVRQRLYNLTIWEKITELYNEVLITKMSSDFEHHYDKWLIRNFGPEIPSMNELTNKVELLFVNIHPIWEGNQPVPPSIIHIWGLVEKPKRELPKDLQSYLDSSKHGVIYASFGTNNLPSNFPAGRIKLLLKVFSQLPYNILFKWDKDVLPDQPKNVKIAKWFPQTDILRHPNLKLFITQGGLQSTDEAIAAGVPLIGIPVLGDQWYNTEKYVHHKIGLKLDLETLTKEELITAINTVIDDESYRRNIKKLDGLMRDEPLSGLQRAVWWSEHALRHGGARHLRAPAANISWADYLELRLLAVLLAGLFAALLVILVAIYSTLKLMPRFVKSKVD